MSTPNHGRPKTSAYEMLGFEFCRVGRKYSARCLACEKMLCNTAATRLQQHRNACKGGNGGDLKKNTSLKKEVTYNVKLETTAANESTRAANEEDFPYKIENYPDPLYFNDTNNDAASDNEDSIAEPPPKQLKFSKGALDRTMKIEKSESRFLLLEITKLKTRFNNYVREHEGEDEMLMKVMLQKMKRLPLLTRIRMQEKFLQDINNELLVVEDKE